jgi:hypothetical protein
VRVTDLGHRRRMSRVTMRVDTVLPRTCWKMATISVRCRNSWGTRTSAPPWSIRMCCSAVAGVSTARSTLSQIQHRPNSVSSPVRKVGEEPAGTVWDNRRVGERGAPHTLLWWRLCGPAWGLAQITVHPGLGMGGEIRAVLVLQVGINNDRLQGTDLLKHWQDRA